MKVVAILSEKWIALFFLIIFMVIGLTILQWTKPVEKSKFCLSDSDCVCGRSKDTGECFFGNKNFVNASAQCPDFCAGIAGNLEIKCVLNECKQVKAAKG